MYLAADSVQQPLCHCCSIHLAYCTCLRTVWMGQHNDSVPGLLTTGTTGSLGGRSVLLRERRWE